jgi:hypothetical protein
MEVLRTRFCLAPASFSPSIKRTGLLTRLTTINSATGPAAEISEMTRFPVERSLPTNAILEAAVYRGDEWHNGNVFERLGFSELTRVQPRFDCVFHLFPFFMDEGELRPIFL